MGEGEAVARYSLFVARDSLKKMEGGKGYKKTAWAKKLPILITFLFSFYMVLNTKIFGGTK
jgi:hypothetical protein